MATQKDNLLRTRMQQQPLLLLMVLLFLVFLSSLLGALFTQLLSNMVGVDYQTAINTIVEQNTLSKRNFLRSATILNQLMTFLLPTLIVIWMAYASQFNKELRLQLPSNIVLVALGILFLFATFPVAQWLFSINKTLPLPASAIALEEKLSELSKALLVMESPWELVFNVLTIALVPAVCEELLFRGVLQQQLSKWMNQPILAIWIAAFIFSAIHGQFQGFLPRLLLGAALGYLLFWTQNLWIPIIAHFFNNAIQILVAYSRTDLLENSELIQDQSIPLLVVAVSSIFVVYLGFSIKKISRHKLGG